MIPSRGITGLFALGISAALVLGCDAHSPLGSASRNPLAASAPSASVPPPPVRVTATFRADSFTVALSWFHDGTQASEWRVERREASDVTWTQIAAGSGGGGHFLDSGVEFGPARPLAYRILACNAAGCGASPTVTVQVPALWAPEALAGVAGADGITLTWVHPYEGSLIYQVLRRTGSAAYSPRVTTAPGARSFVDADVDHGQTYYYRVRALIPAADPATRRFRSSGSSQEASATPADSGAGGPPVARVESAVGTGDASALLRGVVTPNGRKTAVWFQWGNTPTLNGAPTSPVDTIEAGFSPVGVSVPVTGYPIIPYYYRVVAQNDAGLRSSAAVPLRLGPPAQPLVGAAFLRPAHEFVLSWSAAGATTYQVERRVRFGAWSTLATGYTQTSLRDRDVPLDSVHRFAYRVTACSDLGCSGAETSTLTIPLPVPSAYGAVVGRKQVQLVWNTNGAPSSVVYQVRRRTPGSAFGAPVTTPPGVAAYIDRDVIADSTYLYQIRALLPTPGAGNRPSAWTGVLRVTAGVRGATPRVTTGDSRPSGIDQVVLTGTVDVRASNTTAFFVYSTSPDMTPFTTQAAAIPPGASGPTAVSASIPRVGGPLYYRLAARDSAGTVRGAIRSAMYTPATLPPPTGLQGWFDLQSYSAEVRWNAVAGAEYYMVSGARTGGNASFSYAPSNVRSSYNLLFVINACNTRLGCGPSSLPLLVTTAVFEAPGGVQAAALGGGRVLVRWEDRSSGEAAWVVRRCVNSTSSCREVTVQGSGVTSYTDTDVPPGYTYWYRIQALTTDGRKSHYSNPAQVWVSSGP